MKAFLGKRKFLLIPLVIILIILAVVLCPRPQKEIETQTVNQGSITQAISASGTVEADKSVDLTFIAGGKLTYLGIKKGDTVKAGQTIALVDQRTLQKNLENSLQQYLVERNTFEQGREDNNAPTPDDAVNDDIKYLLQTNQFNLNSSVIQVELQAIAKEQSVLTTPISGIVTNVGVKTAGVNITPSTVFSIADPTTLVFQVQVDEADIGKIKVGDSLNLSLDAYPDDNIQLQVSSIDFTSQESDTGGTVFNVKANLPLDGSERYRIGMNGDAEIIIAERNDVPVISIASITDDNAVYVKDGDTWEKRKVETGIQSDTEVEIVSGLKNGEEVALQPDDAAEQVQTKKKQFLFF